MKYTLQVPEATIIEYRVGDTVALTEDAVVLDAMLGEAQRGYDLTRQQELWQTKYRDLLNNKYKCDLTLGHTIVLTRAVLEITKSLKKNINDLLSSLQTTESHLPHSPQKNNGVSSPTSPASKHKEKLKAAKRRVS